MNHNRRKKLVNGKCDCCSREAQIPWKGGQFCYYHWQQIWYYVMEEANLEKKTEEAAKKEKSQK